MTWKQARRDRLVVEDPRSGCPSSNTEIATVAVRPSCQLGLDPMTAAARRKRETVEDRKGQRPAPRPKRRWWWHFAAIRSPLNYRLHALRPAIPQLTRSALRACPMSMAAIRTAAFPAPSVGFSRTDIAEVRTSEGNPVRSRRHAFFGDATGRHGPQKEDPAPIACAGRKTSATGRASPATRATAAMPPRSSPMPASSFRWARKARTWRWRRCSVPG